MGERGAASAGMNRQDRAAKSVALERTHVHDVYDHIAPHFVDTRFKAWPKVKQFLKELEPGSLIGDIGKLINRSNAEATFVQSTSMQRFSKTISTLAYVCIH